MFKLLRTRFIALLTIAFFMFSIIAPSFVMAFDNTQWYTGGQQIGGTTTIADQAQNTELSSDPANNNTVCGDPISVANGEASYTCSDLVIPGRGMDVEIKHTYRSGKNYNLAFGYGWTMNYYYRLHTLDNGNAMIVSGDGRKDEYTYDEPNARYNSPDGFFETLVFNNTDAQWILAKANGETWTFDDNGNLSTITDRNGNQISFTYDPAGRLPIIGSSPYTQVTGERVVVAFDYRLTQITDTIGRVIHFSYNTDGRLTEITGPAGRVVSFAYDPVTDDLLSITKPSTPQYPSGLVKTFQYTAPHLLEHVIDPKGQTFVTNFYNSQGKVYRQDLGEGTFYFDYDVNQTTVTDPNNIVTIFHLNAAGNVILKEVFTQGLRPTDPASFITAYTYNSYMLMTSVTYPKGNGITFVYDTNSSNPFARGDLLQVRYKADMAEADDDLVDIVFQMTYTSNGRSFRSPKTLTDPMGHTTIYTYDYELDPDDPQYAIHGNVVNIEYPLVGDRSPQVHLTYNAYGQLADRVDPNGNSVHYDYFSDTGYLQKIIQDPAGINAVTELAYDLWGNVSSVTDANNHTTTFLYNELNWLVEKTNALGFRTKYTHDQNGNLTKIERSMDPDDLTWQTTQMSYDVLNKLQTVTDPLSHVTTLTYDPGENLASVVDAQNNTTAYQYDERGLMFKVLDANTPQGITQYDYDQNGNLAKIIDANGHTTDYLYDNFDRKIKTTYADATFSQYDYDKNANVILHTAPNAHTIAYVYDALNRLTNVHYAQSPDLDKEFQYDLGSRMTAANAHYSWLNFTYDTLDRLAATHQEMGMVPIIVGPGVKGPPVYQGQYDILYSYDKVGNHTQVTYPSGKIVDYVYDNINQLNEVRVNDVVMAQYAYDQLGRRITRDYLPDVAQRASYQYDNADRLTSLSNVTISDDVISQHTYPSYDTVGNRLSSTLQQGTGTPVTTNYGYNDIYELTQTSTGQTHSFTYDKVNNRTTADGIAYVANALNQYTQKGSQALACDGNGNLTNDGTNTLAFDDDNRLISAENASTSAVYGYDALGRRISKHIDPQATYYIYDGDRVIEDRSADGTLVADYTYGTGIDEVLTMTRGKETYYYHYDGLGSVSDITDTSGAIVESYTYDVYGQPSPSVSAIGNRYLFTGREWDEETGLYHYRARMYSPTLGRFLQRDPVGYLDAMNLYAYVGNNPVNWRDPLGLCQEANENKESSYWKDFWDSFWKLNWKDMDPDYGNWGGNNWSGGRYISSGEIGNTKVPGTDSMDDLFKRHDIESYWGYPNADKNLAQRLRALNNNPRRWRRPPNGIRKTLKAIIYRRFAEFWFK